ncbi:MAG: leucine-rich repeat domain-containing protein [Promethearchaeota archaeon]
MKAQSVFIKGREIKVKRKWLQIHESYYYSKDRTKGILDVKGLDDITDIVRLEILGTDIKKIEGLENLSGLEELFLSANKITEISGLETLTGLYALALDANKITEIKGLDNLVN